jgi:tetratricopeptide (TPR) repeat protein
LSLQHSSEALRLALEAFDNDHDHPQVLEMEHSYAASLISLGRIDDALPYLERSVKAARNTYGDESLIAAHYSVRLGIAHMERGELRKAVELMKFGTETETRIGLRTSPSTSGRFRTLGRVQLFSRRPAEAVPAFERALEIIRPLERPPIQRRLEADLAFAIGASSGAIDAAIIELDKVIRAQDADEARHRTHLPDLYAGALLLWKNDARAAMVYLDRGVPLARAQTRKSELAEGLNSLGVARLALGDATGAAQAFREALELLEQNQVEATPALADTRVGLGCVALAGGDTAAALGHLDEAQKFWETFDPGNRSAGEAAYWRAEALARTGREAEARTAYDLAISNLSMSRLPADAGMVRDARRARSVLVAGAARVGA